MKSGNAGASCHLHGRVDRKSGLLLRLCHAWWPVRGGSFRSASVLPGASRRSGGDAGFRWEGRTFTGVSVCREAGLCQRRKGRGTTPAAREGDSRPPHRGAGVPTRFRGPHALRGGPRIQDVPRGVTATSTSPLRGFPLLMGQAIRSGMDCQRGARVFPVRSPTRGTGIPDGGFRQDRSTILISNYPDKTPL